ncbi:TPA: hypothetical protein ACJVPJ_005288, partial [Klebsiella pneumoniae]
WRTASSLNSGVKRGVPIDSSYAQTIGQICLRARGHSTLNVQFDLGIGVSSSRRKGGAFSTEIIIDISGRDFSGKALRTSHAVVHPGGAAPLTGLGIALIIERLVGLDGKPPVSQGLYFPYQVLDSSSYLARLEQEGGQVLKL